MLQKAKLALRVVTTAFDDEISDLIHAALSDLNIAGIDGTEAETLDPLILRAVMTYCKMHFGQAEPKEYEYLKASYDEQKAQLQITTGYRRDYEAERRVQPGQDNNVQGPVWGTISQRG